MTGVADRQQWSQLPVWKTSPLETCHGHNTPGGCLGSSSRRRRRVPESFEAFGPCARENALHTAQLAFQMTLSLKVVSGRASVRFVRRAAAAVSATRHGGEVVHIKT